jgi:hypothetical protein
MADFTVSQRGIDTSGRPILATGYMWAWWESVVAELGWRPTIVQGAFMSRVPGGGAVDSAGYHDLGGCFDLRTRDLTPYRSEKLVRTLRRFGAAAWRRDATHGRMDAHLHLVLGTDKPLAKGAVFQWAEYRAGGDGIGGTDYEWRPSPLVLTPPEDEVSPEDKAQLDRIEARLEDIDKVLRRITKSKREIIAAVEDES